MWRRSMVVAATLAVTAGVARADSVVVESYGGARPAEAGELFAPVARELARQGFLAGADLAQRIDDRLSRPANVLGASELDTAAKFASSGEQLYNQGNFAQAIKDLDNALAAYDRAPVTLAVDPSLRQQRFDTLVFLALAHGRKRNQTGAVSAMSELIRSFPDKEIGLSKFPPDARKLRRKVAADLEAQGLGSLKVTVDDARTGVFVNERYVGGGSQEVGKLVPGRYRVYVQQGKVRGRLHVVDVQPGTEASVSITWMLDSALETRGDAVWLSFESEADRAAHETAVSLHLARALGGGGVAVLGLREEKGKRSAIGVYLGVDSSSPVRGGVLAADPVLPSDAKMADLGRFLAGDDSLKGAFQPIGGGDQPAADDDDDGGLVSGPVDHGGSRYGTWKWVTLLGGVAAVGTGVTLIAIHKDAIVDGMRQSGARNTKTAGYITTGVGAALALTSVYLWVKDAGSGGEARGTAVVPTSGGAMVTWSGRF